MADDWGNKFLEDLEKREDAQRQVERLVMPHIDYDVYDIVEDYLKQHGFDGMYNSEGECACEVGNISPASCLESNCKPGYKKPCPDYCGDHDFHIIAEA